MDNEEKVCRKCGTPLTGRQGTWCSLRCNKLFLKAQYRKRNAERINAYNRDYRSKHSKPVENSMVG